MTINCIVIDDEFPAITQMEEYISRIPFLNNLQSFDNAIEPLNFLKHHDVDLVFLDIEMDGFTGLQFIKTLRNKPQIILTTAYNQYAIEAFNLNVIDYLLKPISFERFLQGVDKVFDMLNIKEGENVTGVTYKKDYAFFKTEYRLQRIDFKDILYIEGMKEYLRIHTLNGKILTLMVFKELEAILPTDKFIRVHKSYVVAVDKIDNVERQRIQIKDNLIPISDKYKDAFFNYIKSN